MMFYPLLLGAGYGLTLESCRINYGFKMEQLTCCYLRAFRSGWLIALNQDFVSASNASGQRARRLAPVSVFLAQIVGILRSARLMCI